MAYRPRYQYWIDDFNRLVVQEKAKNGRLLGQPTVLKGFFELANKNQLRYRLSTPAKILKDLNIRSTQTTLSLKGKWSLTKDHKLQYILNRSLGQLVLKADYMDADQNHLIFSVTTRDNQLSSRTRVFQFEGKWQVDRSNRLSFRLTHRKSRQDRLAFQSVWEINKQHQLIYRFSSEQLTRRRKKEHVLILRGNWKISKKAFIDYYLRGNQNRRLRFRAQFVGHSHLNKDKAQLMFRVGVLVHGSTKRLFRSVVLTGQWTFYQKLTLGFEVEYEKGEVEEMKFKVRYRPTNKNEIILGLLNQKNRPLGIELILSKKILNKRADFFIRAKKQGKEKAVESGITIPWG